MERSTQNHRPMNYDVVIVGAGPAGSTAAKHLAENNIHVLLLDKYTFPRKKPCGGGLPIRAVEKFPYLKDAGVIESYSYGGYGHYSLLEYVAKVEKNEPILAMIQREKFDHTLVQLAMESGAQFLEGKTVVDVTISKDHAPIAINPRGGLLGPFRTRPQER